MDDWGQIYRRGGDVRTTRSGDALSALFSPFSQIAVALCSSQASGCHCCEGERPQYRKKPKYGMRRRKNLRLRNQKSGANGLVWTAAAGSLGAYVLCGGDSCFYTI
ncbi:hypothetical protein Salat_1507100 [Sesamum alatum]|uniref:Uncharacterized protein n=1 Tax=Sesamum alatum TaxID=300844 RepID=A0AAE2CM87_9LAMI|nr:hypothetical protein Salat_1507100 [Sesamum alatum]